VRLDARTAIVTGGGRGIGRAIAMRLATEGANVVVTDLDLEEAANVAGEIEGLGASALAIQADAASPTDAEAAAAQTIDAFGRIDILVNNAGLASQYREGTELERWDLGIDTTLSSAYRQSRAVVGHMAEAGGGALLNVCSIAGNKVGTPVPWYDAAKAGLVGLTRHLAGTHGPAGIRANSLCLGLIETRRTAFIHQDDKLRDAIVARTPLRRVGQPEEAAAAACFLVSDDASLITGQVLVADGGSTIA
jgi:NAD(P)-dependent dehydrogenase (short-subunit alcohol dehydrogenase family)